MGGKSNYLEQKILNHVLRGNTGGTAFTQPAAIYLALFTVDPGDAGAGTEVSGGAYVRQSITFNAPVLGSPTASTNVSDVTFPVASANWGTIVSAGVFDALTGGNMLYYGSLPTSKLISQGDQFIIKAGNYTASEE